MRRDTIPPYSQNITCSAKSGESFSAESYCVTTSPSARDQGKAWVPKKRVDPIIENVTLEPELEEALASATDAELCDIAGKSERLPRHGHDTQFCRTF